MRKLVVVLFTIAFLSVAQLAMACPQGSRQIGGGAPGFPRICAMRIEYTNLFYVFPW